MDYIIGVDAGGTKTEAIAYDIEGNALLKSLKGFGNLVNNKEQALNNIVASTKEIVEKLGSNDLKGLYLGVAGSEVGENTKIIRDKIKNKLSLDAVVINDGELALKAMLKGENGILTIAGTGSIAFGINDNKSARSGGWGHLLGDEGSGYKIAVDAIKIMIHEKDYNLEKCNLTKEIMNKLNIKSVDEIISFVYSSTKDDIASISPLLSKLGDEGDEVARMILAREGLALGRTTESVYKKLGFKKAYIGLVGGVIKNSKILRVAFEEYLREKINVIDFVDEEISSTKGAYYMYLKENK